MFGNKFQKKGYKWQSLQGWKSGHICFSALLPLGETAAQILSSALGGVLGWTWWALNVHSCLQETPNGWAGVWHNLLTLRASIGCSRVNERAGIVGFQLMPCRAVHAPPPDLATTPTPHNCKLLWTLSQNCHRSSYFSHVVSSGPFQWTRNCELEFFQPFPRTS